MKETLGGNFSMVILHQDSATINVLFVLGNTHWRIYIIITRDYRCLGREELSYHKYIIK